MIVKLISVFSLTVLLSVASLAGLSPAKANYVYDVSYVLNPGNAGATTVTGDIVLNCNSCNLTSLDLVLDSGYVSHIQWR